MKRKNTFPNLGAGADMCFMLYYLGGPLCGERVPARWADARGIWLAGGVYRFSPEFETYTWREQRRLYVR